VYVVQRWRQNSFIIIVIDLRFASRDKPWIEAHVTDMMSVEHPRQKTLETETVATMRTSAVCTLTQEQQNLQQTV